eukprot:1873266-Rhodomonas_salina.1
MGLRRRRRREEGIPSPPCSLPKLHSARTGFRVEAEKFRGGFPGLGAGSGAEESCPRART